ncbi:alcohol dehydrogenase catalytic domain-containing protein [Pseudahrensia aquimaris]|uniref:Alcohol dehydrogenase catalytic domain-containing protein n=1 Tax=Pseudahrensia aquimaris TaxID=744461 RepID=A0ABW3FEG4_9HYPH
MRALFYTGTQQSEIRETPDPVAVDGEAHVDVSYCGICGSDMHAWHGHDPRRVPPMILGHEAVGIARAGQYAGKRVAINPLMTCGSCRHCLSGDDHLCAERDLIGMFKAGAYAEQVVVAERNLYPLADEISDEDAALAEPLAVCVHAVEIARKTLRRPVSESRCVVLGGGAIGVLTAMVLADQGAKDLWIAEPNALRREVLEKACAVKAYDPAQGGPAEKSADLVIDCVGAPVTRKAASGLVMPGGTIVHVGLQEAGEGLDTRYFTLQEITFAGTYCYTRYDFAAALQLLTRGLVGNREWIEVRPLEQGAQSFVDIHEGNAPPKIILKMG